MKVAFVTSFLFAELLSGQTATTGQIEGIVRDPTGAMVAGAKIILTSEAALTRETQSDSSGTYLFTLLPPGNYRLEVASQGFKTAAVENIAVRITETSRVDVAMAVAAAAGEVMNVSAEAALVQTNSPATGRVVDELTIREVPLATRNFTQILGLSTGTATYLPDNTAVGRNSQNISVNGARVTNNNFVINGADANSIGTNSAPSLAVPAPETLEEFKVQTSMYDATYGRSGGGNIQVITKSGQNSFHGDLYEYFRNDALNANDPFLKAAGVARPELKRNVFGATLGGPVKKDKMFFFLSYQGTREVNAASRINSVSSNVLIANGLTNDRSQQTLLSAFHPTLANGTAVSSVNPISLALLNAKLPNGQYVIPTPQAGGRYSGATPSDYNEDQVSAGFDDHLSANNTLSTKFFLFNAPQTLVLPSFLGAGANVPGFGNNQYNSGRILSLQDTHVFSPRMLNEARLTYSFLRVDAFPQQPVNDQTLGIQRSTAAAYPGLGMIQIAPSAGGIAFGTAPLIDVVAQGGTSSASDTLSTQMGKHSLRIGAGVRLNLNLYDVGFYTRGLIQFLSFNDFLTGNTLVSLFGNGVGRRTLRSWDYNLFAQDDWKITRKLTLNIGLRYELDDAVAGTGGSISAVGQIVNPGALRADHLRQQQSAADPVCPQIPVLMPAIRVNDVDLYYETAGEGPPLLLIHGLGSSVLDWEDQIGDFARSYRVIAFDVRGHGRSGRPSGPYSVAQFARDAGALLMALGAGPAHVVGLSRGGMIAFQMAVDSPELVRSTIRARRRGTEVQQSPSNIEWSPDGSGSATMPASRREMIFPSAIAGFGGRRLGHVGRRHPFSGLLQMPVPACSWTFAELPQHCPYGMLIELSLSSTPRPLHLCPIGDQFFAINFVVALLNSAHELRGGIQ